MTSIFTNLARQRIITAAPGRATRLAHTIPRPPTTPHYSFSERMHKFVPVEAYPLVTFVVCMSTFGLTYGFKAFTAVPGELRLMPTRVGHQDRRKEVWED